MFPKIYFRTHPIYNQRSQFLMAPDKLCFFNIEDASLKFLRNILIIDQPNGNCRDASLEVYGGFLKFVVTFARQIFSKMHL